MHSKSKARTEVPPYSSEWVRTKVIAVGATRKWRPQLQLITMMPIGTGCRPGEIINLRVEDFQIDGPVPYIFIRARTDREVKRIRLNGISPWWASLLRRPDGQALMPESCASFETALPNYGCVPEAAYTTSGVSLGRRTLSDAPIPRCIHGRRIQRDALTGKMAKAVRRPLWRARSRSELDRQTLAGADGKG